MISLLNDLEYVIETAMLSADFSPSKIIPAIEDRIGMELLIIEADETLQNQNIRKEIILCKAEIFLSRLRMNEAF